MTLIQEIGLVTEVGQEIVLFTEGQNVVVPPVTIGGVEYDAEVQKFGATQPAPPYMTIGGSILTILETVFTLYATASSGSPIYLAEKIGNVWYGEKLTPKVKTA